MNDWTASQIKEIVRIEVEAERRLRDALRKEDRRWFESKLKEAGKALELQAKEYERRLSDLNHSHAEAQRVLGTYIPRELYERSHAELIEWQRKADILTSETNNRIKSVELGLVNLPGGIKSLELGLASQTGHQIGTRATTTTIVAIIAVSIATISMLIVLLNYLNK